MIQPNSQLQLKPQIYHIFQVKIKQPKCLEKH